MKALLFTTLILLSFTSNAQQEHLSSMFWNNYTEFNPAATGLENKHQGIVSYRNQWPSLSGNERTYFANYNTRVGRHHGVGGNITRGKIGFTEYQEVQANYSYQHVVGDSRRISFGAGPSLTRNRFSSPWEPPFESMSNTLNFNVGFAYQGKTILTGIGATQLFAIELSNNAIVTNLVPHYYFHFRKIFELNRNMDVYLEGLYRNSNGFHSADINARMVLFNKFMFGVGYRGRNTIITQIGWDIKDHFRIAYSHDISVSKLSASYGASHEFSLGYVMKYRVRRPFSHMGTPNF